jgi:transcriptional regulator with XRE-family HTH domain
MEIYERIMNRRKELGLTADAVADALGVSRSTIYRYESAYIEKVPLSSLEPLAKVLKTTPQFLMGWECDPDGFGQNDINHHLSTDETELIGNYNSLNIEGKKKLVERSRELLALGYKKGSLPEASSDTA